MVKQSAGGAEPPLGTRCQHDQALDRTTLVAEARCLIEELNEYLELIGQWAMEEDPDE